MFALMVTLTSLSYVGFALVLDVPKSSSLRRKWCNFAVQTGFWLYIHIHMYAHTHYMLHTQSSVKSLTLLR